MRSYITLKKTRAPCHSIWATCFVGAPPFASCIRRQRSRVLPWTGVRSPESASESEKSFVFLLSNSSFLMLREIQPLSHLEIREIRRSFGEMNCLFRWWQLIFFFDCSPLLGGRFPIWRAYVSNGLVQPPASLGCAVVFKQFVGIQQLEIMNILLMQVNHKI